MKINSRKPVLVLASAALITVSSCNTAVPGQPTATSVGANPSGVTPRQKAPDVSQPLDASKYLGAPCASLTQAQLNAFKVRAPGKPENIDGNPNCRWAFGVNGDIGAGLTFMPSVKEGLSNLYALAETGWWSKGYFEPTTVENYPAAYNSVADLRNKGDCTLSVAITSSLFFTVNINARSGNDVCTAAKNVAADVIDTIKRGA